MRNHSTAKYGFRIRTRSGAIVDNLLIFGSNGIDAERKLRQIYSGCEVLEARRFKSRMHGAGALCGEEIADLVFSPDPFVSNN